MTPADLALRRRRRRMARAVGAALLVLPVAAACRREPPPLAAEALYRRYCASCHGLAGRGDGPVAGALSPPPTDLTGLGNRGMPELMAQIDGRRAIRAHGTSAMPVWGAIFEQSLVGEPHARRTALLEVEALAQYVQELGRRTP